VADFERELVPLRKSGTAADVPVSFNTWVQQERIIDAVHARLEPTLLTTYVYETDQSTPLEDICFAPNDVLSNEVGNWAISHQGLSTYFLSIPSVSFDAHFSFHRFSITGAGSGSDQCTWARRNGEDSVSSLMLAASPHPPDSLVECEVNPRPDTPYNLQPIGLGDFSFGLTFVEGTSQHQADNISETRTIPECDLSLGSEPEKHSLEGTIEDMLVDYLQYLPLSELPLRAPVRFPRTPYP
jgi:hypothetical protein